PATKIELADPEPIQRSIAVLQRYSCVVFTSQNAVQIFLRALAEAKLDVRALAGKTIAAVGPMTSLALREGGLTPDIMPDRFVAEALLDAIRDHADVRGRR